MFADDTKIIRVIKSRTDFLVLQNDLDSLFNWSKLWQLNFSISKCKLMRFGYSHQYGTYTLGDTKIDSVESHRDLGILFDNRLKFHQHTTSVAAKANRILGLIKKSFESLDQDMLARLFKTLVRPIIEYGNTIWGPHIILDQRKLENIQRRATRLVENLQDKSCAERLQIMNLPSLKFRRLRGDLIFMYQDSR